MIEYDEIYFIPCLALPYFKLQLSVINKVKGPSVVFSFDHDVLVVCVLN